MSNPSHFREGFLSEDIAEGISKRGKHGGFTPTLKLSVEAIMQALVTSAHAANDDVVRSL